MRRRAIAVPVLLAGALAGCTEAGEPAGYGSPASRSTTSRADAWSRSTCSSSDGADRRPVLAPGMVARESALGG
ncbi:hypothetical protein ASF48_08290 [Rathayibacter sp. Leaf299]|nr:hypothetical protein ASF48_08290 [Rathayibacter sp. Leaf299]